MRMTVRRALSWISQLALRDKMMLDAPAAAKAATTAQPITSLPLVIRIGFPWSIGKDWLVRCSVRLFVGELGERMSGVWLRHHYIASKKRGQVRKRDVREGKER